MSCPKCEGTHFGSPKDYCPIVDPPQPVPVWPPKFKGATCKGCFALGSACGNCERCDWERTQHGEYGGLLQPPKTMPIPKPQLWDGPQRDEAFRELLAAAKLMDESLPLYSPSSAAYTRKKRLDAAIVAAENFFSR